MPGKSQGLALPPRVQWIRRWGQPGKRQQFIPEQLRASLIDPRGFEHCRLSSEEITGEKHLFQAGGAGFAEEGDRAGEADDAGAAGEVGGGAALQQRVDVEHPRHEHHEAVESIPAPVCFC